MLERLIQFALTQRILMLLLVALITVAMSLAAALWPSWEASNLKPMDIIRYT